MFFYLSLFVLVITLGASLLRRRFFRLNLRITYFIRPRSRTEFASGLPSGELRSTTGRIYESIFIFSIILIFVLLVYQSYQQYQIWSQDNISKFLLPPHQGISYFLFYVFTRFFAPYLISLIAAVVFFIAARFLNKKYDERFFEPEEYYFGALSLFLVGHPGWLFYVAFIIAIYFIAHLFLQFYYIVKSNSGVRVSPREVRISLRYWWIPVGIIVIIISNYWLLTLVIWQILKI